MVLIGGPRQVGKTTLALDIARAHFKKNGLYLNWDDLSNRKTILSQNWPIEAKLLIFDEIHKYHRWKNWLKGVYDTQKSKHSFLVTGSARLDVYKRGGDSMLGRYHYWRLHPFCLAENPKNEDPQVMLHKLLKFGGFPEPYLSGDEIEAKRWRRERLNQVLREDIRDLEKVTEISALDLLLELLRTRVGGEVVYSNLAQDLEKAPKTIKKWIELLERMYLVFAVTPFSGSLPTALKKTPKVYFFDIADVEDNPGARFENLVACHLLKRLHYLEDSQGDVYKLHYLRDKQGHEVDFLIVKNRKPFMLVEAKWSDQNLHRNLNYFGNKLGVARRVQIVAELKQSYEKDGVEIVPASRWLSRPLNEL